MIIFRTKLPNLETPEREIKTKGRGEIVADHFIDLYKSNSVADSNSPFLTALASAVTAFPDMGLHYLLMYSYKLKSVGISEAEIHQIHTANLMLSVHLKAKKAQNNNRMPIREMGFKTRAYNALKSWNIYTVADLQKLTLKKLHNMHNVGPATISHILTVCKANGIELNLT